MSKRVSNKKGTTHRKRVRPARSGRQHTKRAFSGMDYERIWKRWIGA